ncbi:MAG TPA: branched-chain amino acid ABC transporter permease [Acidiferrobacterales bacterium]|nr:branched-chain amino acid ABC transporter permease [Acidiferrobacterales bacterium]
MVLNFLGVVFDGLAYGMLLFLISVGLSVTMGLMGFINLAHGAFAMAGGYLAVTLMNAGWPFLATLPVVFIVVATAALLCERAFYRPLYRASSLDQVLLTVGLIFMAMAAATYIWGSAQQPVRLPAYFSGQLSLLGLELSRYRLFLIGVGAAITLALVFGLERTRFGAKVRAAVDNQRMAAGIGINVGAVFQITFALGSGLAGLGGALGIDVLGLDPAFPIKYLVYFLLVVAVGGAGSVQGTLAAALLLGVSDVAGKYYIPQVGAFVIYAVMVLLLLLRPEGLTGRRAAT